MALPTTINFYTAVNNGRLSLDIVIFSTLFLALAGAIALSFEASEHFLYRIWADREFLRAGDLPQYFRVYGAEFNNQMGRSTPGGAYIFTIFYY